MKSWSRALAIALLVLTLVVAVLIAMAWFALPLDGITVTVRRPELLARRPARAAARRRRSASPWRWSSSPSSPRWSWSSSALGVGALGIAFGLLTAAASLAVVLSPFALIAWLLWRLFHRSPGAGRRAPAMTTAVIADDERLLREQLRARLAEVWPALEIVAEAKNGAEAVALTEKHRPDIVFLDIRMPGMTGIEAARAIAQLPVDDDDAETSASGDGPPWHGPEIVFITAYDQYAIEAFEQGVVDYVLKPAERDRLQVTVDRVKKRLADRSAGEAPDASGMQQLLQKLTAKIDPGAHPRLKWIQATVGASIQMIPVEDVLFFISDEKYTRVQTATLEALIRKPIKELVDELDADQFWQIHRSTLVNTRMIAGVTRDLRGRQLVAVRGHPEKLEVSRSYAGLFKGM